MKVEDNHRNDNAVNPEKVPAPTLEPAVEPFEGTQSSKEREEHPNQAECDGSFEIDGNASKDGGLRSLVES
jgi:hypothetical protein